MRNGQIRVTTILQQEERSRSDSSSEKNLVWSGSELRA
jgi:hypothetical protein